MKPTFVERLYAALLHLYPLEFRLAYGEPMAQLFGDLMRDAEASSSPRRAVATTWFRGLVDLGVSAITEHARGEPSVGQSFRIVAPSRSSRLLGLLGIVGGLWLLSAWFVFFSEAVNVARLVVFNLGAIAIAIGVTRTWSDRLLGRGRAATAAVVLANVAYAASIVLTMEGRPRVFGDNDAFVWMIVGVALWLADGFFGLVATRLPGLAKIGGAALVAGSLSALGVGGLVFVEPGVMNFFGNLALAGAFLNGVGWILLGLALNRRRVMEAPPA